MGFFVVIITIIIIIIIIIITIITTLEVKTSCWMSVLKDGLSLIRLTLFYKVMLYGNPFVCTFCLVSSTITERTSRWTTAIIHKIWTTISHFDVCWPFTAAWFPVKTDLPADLTVCYSGVNSIHESRLLRRYHTCHKVDTKVGILVPADPSKRNHPKSTVTGMVVIWVRYLSVSCIETHVILAFCSKMKYNRPFYSCGLSTLAFEWMWA